MTPERWREIEALVDEALRLPGAERARFVVGRCADDGDKLEAVLDLLLAADEADGIATPAWSPPAAEPPVPAGDGAPPDAEERRENGRWIGSFRVLDELGRGGMGTVLLAEQRSPVERRVAIKVAHTPLGAEGRRRLAAERQAMARLAHPHIARILEAGSTDDGFPYFAMELVEGAPITADCDRRRLGIEARLRLFLAVCAGVQHAHQKGILHRDLKPSNILVAEVDGRPVPKIIDFGIAKALDRPLSDRTLETGRRILGTPAYLAPEALGDPAAATFADTRGDVYSLGVVLQELLIGELPFARARGESPLAAWRRKAEEDPASPSRRWQALAADRREVLARRRGLEDRTLGRRLRGDLDAIVQKAIARDPAKRYPAVSELAADVARHLAHEPVLAGPPGSAYQLRKLVRRHRVGVLFTSLVVLALAGGLVARSLEAARANREAAEALAAREETEEVSTFLTELFTSADPGRDLGRDLTVREVLEAGTARLESAELRDVPRVRARLLGTIAQVHWSLGDAAAALPLAEESLALHSRELGTGHPDTVASLALVGTLASEVGDYPRSEALLEQALALALENRERDPARIVRVLSTLGAIHEETTRFDQAASFYRRALGLLEEAAEPDPLEIANLLSNLGVVHWRLNDDEQAEALHRRALALREQALDPQHPSVALSLNNLGEVLSDRGRPEEALTVYRRALAIRETVLGDGHPQLGVTLNSMGTLARRLGRWDQAEELIHRARGVWEEALGAEHFWLAYADNNLGILYWSQGRDGEAEAVHRSAMGINRAAGRDSDLAGGIDLALLGRSLRLRGRSDEASATLVAALDRLEGEPHGEWYRSLGLVERALIALEQRRFDAAQGMLEQARAESEAYGPPDSGLGNVLFALARLARARGRHAEAESLATEALECFAVDLPDNHRLVREARAFRDAG